MYTLIDSTYTREEMLAQNPHNRAPDEVLADLEPLDVAYLGYDSAYHQGQIVVHRAVVDEIKGFFHLAYELGFPVEKVIPICAPAYGWDDERSCTDNNSSAYNYRLIAGTDRLSRHARGLAFDINPRQNIFVRYDEAGNVTYRLPHDGVYDPEIPGTLTADHPLVTHMKTLGWVWGGDWKKEEGRVDYQHFEKEIAG